MNKKLLALYGLKYNPFTPEIPIDALYSHPKIENFCWRIENILLREGGFALVSGEPGSGKSIALRVLADRLKTIRDAQVGIIVHAMGKYRVMCTISGELLATAAKHERVQLDEKLYLECFAAPQLQPKRKHN